MFQKPFEDQSLEADNPPDGGGRPPADPQRRLTVKALSAGVLSASGVPPVYPLVGETAAALFPNASLLILSLAAAGSGTVRILHAPDRSQIGLDIAVSPQMAADLEGMHEAGPLSAGRWAGLFGTAGAGPADPYGIPVGLHDERLFVIIRPAPAGSAQTGRGLDAATSLAVLAGLARVKERLWRTAEERDKLQERVRHLLARQKDLDFKANHDDLTGLPNRKFIRTLAEDRLGRRTGDSLYALAFIDLDNFKQVNDLYGHAVGDQLLRTVASRVRCEIRSSDICGRVGGDEFVVCIDDVEQPAHCETIFARIRNALSRPFEIDGHTIGCSATVGVAYFPQDGTGYDELLRAADAAMYRAKRIGKAAP